MEKKKMTNIRLLDDDNKLVDYWNVDQSIDIDELMREIIRTLHAVDEITGRTKDYHLETQKITVWA